MIDVRKIVAGVCLNREHVEGGHTFKECIMSEDVVQCLTELRFLLTCPFDYERRGYVVPKSFADSFRDKALMDELGIKVVGLKDENE